jgi:hypothetical protein
MSPTKQPRKQAQIVMDIAGQKIQDASIVYVNLGQGIILTNEDKIRICLMEHLGRMEGKRAWFVPLGIFLTILVVFPTTTFHDFLVSGDTWRAVFILCGGISFIWLIIAVIRSRVSSSLEDVVDAIKRTNMPRPRE